MKNKERERERHDIDDETWEDQTGNGPWEFKGEIYHYIKEELVNGDGECHRVIVKRESDEKHFEFTWQLYRENYHMDDEIVEVFPVTTITVSYE
jgi:hypothetical protein